MTIDARPAASAATALDRSLASDAAALASERFRKRLIRGLFFMTLLCLAIALLLGVIGRGGFGVQLIYSFSIGFCCWLVTDAARLVICWVVDTQRIRRGDPAAAVGFDLHVRGMLPLVALGILVGPSAGMTLADTITGYRSPSIWQLDTSTARVTLTITVIASLLTMFVLTTLERLARARADAEAAMRAAAENQLKLLESQLEPHMLFNTLANLRVLIGIDPPRAQAMLDQLIGFLRATLNASRSGAHPLAAEFDRIGDYLSLMAIRMGPRLEFALDLPAALRDQPVPPLLLQPLVENCIKHGLEPQLAGGRIDIAARRAGPMLELTVQDNGAGLGQAGSPGSTRFGLEQVRGRLKALFGDGAALTLELSPGGGTLARIVLPIKAAD